MRIVHHQDELEQLYKIATAEAQVAFNDPSVFIEKYLENPKHIEFQIVADNYGNVVHLGDRECSIQRKHQKPRHPLSTNASGKKWQQQQSPWQNRQAIKVWEQWNSCSTIRSISISWR